jgi:hypothetical protein
VNRSFRADVWALINPEGVAPGSILDNSPLALNKEAVLGRHYKLLNHFFKLLAIVESGG